MLNVVRTWIIFSTLLVASGWVLSALHELNETGYAAVFALAAVAFVFWIKKTRWHPLKTPRQLAHKFIRRFRRWEPLLFLMLAVLCLAGGLFYPPIDGDSTAYRIPRIFHWLGQQEWHWIRGSDFRLNIAGCGFEWISAPLVLFTRTDRFIFLVNWVPYLMLPGLIFGLFRQLQVCPRVAWWWMWVLSSGWCFVMQAGSTVNDSFAVIYALASVDLALRALQTGRIRDLWLSMLAAALLTGVKQTDIPLVLLWLIPACAAWRLWRTRIVMSIGVAGLALLVSTAPLCYFNFKYTGSWLGISNQAATGILAGNVQINNPVWGVIGNLFCLPVQNLAPPFFPWCDQWDQMMRHFLTTSFGTHFTSFERFGYLRPGLSDSSAGIGLGISLFTVISIVAAWKRKPARDVKTQKVEIIHRLLRILPWGLLLLFMASVGTEQNARHLAPYYIFFFPLFLAGSGHAFLVRCSWWQSLAYWVMGVTGLLLLLAVQRPLVPIGTFLDKAQAKCPHSNALAKVRHAYAYQIASQKVGEYIRDNLPPDQRTIGYICKAGRAEPFIWVPFGAHDAVRLLPDDTLEMLRQWNIHYVVVEGPPAESNEHWIARYQASVTAPPLDDATIKAFGDVKIVRLPKVTK